MDLTDKYLVNASNPQSSELYVLSHLEDVAFCLVYTDYGRISMKAIRVSEIMDYGVVNKKPPWLSNLYKLVK